MFTHVHVLPLQDGEPSEDDLDENHVLIIAESQEKVGKHASIASIRNNQSEERRNERNEREREREMREMRARNESEK
jgi:hypothetical protein